MNPDSLLYYAMCKLIPPKSGLTNAILAVAFRDIVDPSHDVCFMDGFMWSRNYLQERWAEQQEQEQDMDWEATHGSAG
jgi:hypothetical protein